MKTAWIAIARACNVQCSFCSVASRLDGARRSAADVQQELEQASDAGVERVVFTGGEPTLSAQLVRAISAAKHLGMKTAMSTNGRLLCDEERAGRIRAAGLDAVYIGLHAVTESVHRELIGGDPPAYQQTRQALELCSTWCEVTIRTVLTRRNLDEVQPLLALAASLGASFDLRCVQPQGAARRAWSELALDPDAAIDCLHATRAEAIRLGVPFSFGGFPRHQRLAGETPIVGAPFNEQTWWAIRRDLPSREMLGGLRAPPADLFARWAEQARLAPSALVQELALRHLPILDLPQDVGGVGHALPDSVAMVDGELTAEWSSLLGHVPPHAARRTAHGAIHVLDCSLEDPWLGLSTLPGLAADLSARGAEVVHHRIWEAPFDRDSFDPPVRRAMLGRVGSGLRRALRRTPTRLTLPHPETPGDQAVPQVEAFLASLDLAGAAVVVVSNHEEAGAVRRHPTFPRDARVVILEHALLGGFDGTLGDHDVVRSPWPSRHRVYDLAGVGPQRVLYRPEPVYLAHLQAPPAMSCRNVLIIGGSDVDERLIRGAVRKSALPVQRVGAGQLGSSVGPRWSDALDALARARFVVWAKQPSQGTPADTRWLALAQSAARPVLAADILEARAYVHHDHDGLLIAPGHRRAMSSAFKQLSSDDDLISRLATGAVSRRASLSTDALAGEVIHGSSAARAVRDGTGPWFPW